MNDDMNHERRNGMEKQTKQVSALIGLAVILALVFPLVALAEIKQVQMGIDGMT